MRLIQQSGTLLLTLLLSVGCYQAISHFLLQTVQVVGESMVPTLEEHGHYLLNRWAFQHREPKAGEIVVLRDPADHGFSVKRVIATSGQSVLFKDGKVFVDGSELKEPYLLPGTLTWTYAKEHEQLLTCGKGQFFVLGDNRLKSIDSRCYGMVPRQNILGLVMVR